MGTDIERLHKVISGELTGRGCGKTFARCHELAGQVKVGEFGDIVVGITQYHDLSYLHPMIRQVFEEHDLKIEGWQRDKFICNGKRIRFLVEDSEWDYKTRGLTFHYQPMGHYD